MAVRETTRAATFCALCWGQAYVLEPARNGEGLIPLPCDGCGGTGWTLPRDARA